MTKKNKCFEEVTSLFDSKKFDDLERYLLKNSNLPGRRANIGLVSAVADIVEKNQQLSEQWVPIFDSWFEWEADGDDPETLLVLTALECFGAMYSNSTEKQKDKIKINLLHALNDSRWRVREIVTESYKRVALSSYKELEELFNSIRKADLTPLEVRGILATVAHSELLVTENQLNHAQSIMEEAFEYYLNVDLNRYSKEAKLALKKGLSFAPSVIINKNPEEGFRFFERLIVLDDKQINSIIKENLKKKRLASVYEDEVEEILNKMNR